MTPDELEDAVLAGDRDLVRTLICAASPDERHAAAGRIHELARRLSSTRALVDDPSAAAYARRRASVLALYGTGSAAQIRSGRWNFHGEEVVEVLRGRPSGLLDDLAPVLVERLGWRVVRQLVREGVMASPTSDAYIVGLLDAQYDASAIIREDPGVLEHEIWRLFEVEGTQQFSLADHDKYTRGSRTWAEALAQAAREDPAVRSRMLDASLGALERDFPAFRAGWFGRFHESLAPTPDERARRVAAYLRLVRSPIGPTVSFAVDALGALQRARMLDPADLLSHVRPALTVKAAGTATAALKLLDRAIATRPDLAPRGADIAAAALAHRSTEVQAASLSILERLVRRDGVVSGDALLERRDDVASSLRPRFDALLARVSLQPEGQPVTGRAAPAPTEPPDGAHTNVATDALAALQPITPIATLPELAEVVAHVLEAAGPPDEIERVLDGIARLSADRPPDFGRLTGSIRRRAHRLQARKRERSGSEYGDYSDVDVPANLAALVIAWIDGIEPMPPREPCATLGRYLVGRIAEVAHWAAARTAEPMLAAPTHAGGWIEPSVIVDRLAARLSAGRTPPEWFELDLAQAMLRMLPVRRDRALSSVRPLAGEAAAAIRYALGEEAAIGGTRSLWVAAARCRNPDGDDPALEAAHPGLGPDGAFAGSFRLEFARTAYGSVESRLVSVPPVEHDRYDVPTALLASVAAQQYGIREHEALLDWARLIWPRSRRGWFATASMLMLRNLDWWSAEWANRIRMEPLFEPWTAIGREAALLLAVTLQAKEPGERGYAVEATASLFDDGRLTPDALVAACAELADLAAHQPPQRYPAAFLRPQRLATSLMQVAATSPRNAASAQDVAFRVLPLLVATAEIPISPVGQLASLLRVLTELVVLTDEPVPAHARPALVRLAGGGGAVARLASRLLAA